MSNENPIPDRIGGGNYTLELHARLVLNAQRAEAELEKARELLSEAQSTALSTRTFNTQVFQDVTPPQTVIMGDTALTIAFSPGRGGGWTYTESAVVA